MLEYKENVKTFEDPDIISVDSTETEHYKTVAEEIERGKRLNKERRYWKKEKRPEIRPLFEKELQIKRDDRPVMYREIVERFKPKSPVLVCRHFGNFVLDRSILTRNEHIDFLSQPRFVKYPMRREQIKAYKKKIFLSNVTARIEELAVPRLRHMENTIINYSRHLKTRQLENLTFFLTGKNREIITSIDKAITLMQEEKYRKNILRNKYKRELDEIRQKIQCKRFKQVVQIIWSLFEVMKDYLMTEHAINLKSEMRLLSNVIVYGVAEFSGYDIPSPKSQEFIDKFIIDLSDNLAIWIEKFTTNFGFCPLLKEGPLPKRKSKMSKDSKSTSQDTDKVYQCQATEDSLIDESKEKPKTIRDFKDGKGSLYLPIDDYIPLSDSSLSDLEGFLCQTCEETLKESESEDFCCEDEGGEEDVKIQKSR